MSRILLVLILSLSFAGASFAAMYKWVDKEGNVHYGDCPPADCKPKQIEAAPAPSQEEIEQTRKRTERLIQEQKKREDARKIEREKTQSARQQQLNEELKEQHATELTDIQRGARTPVPGGTGAPPTLQRDVLRILVIMDSAKDPACTNHKIINTETVDMNRETRTAVERWTLDRCGEIVRYRVTFMPASQGGTNFSVQAE